MRVGAHTKLWRINMSETAKTNQGPATMVPVEKAGKLLQEAVAKTAEVVGDTYEKFYEDKPAKTEPAKVEPTPEVKASSTEVAQPEASKEVAPEASAEAKTEEQAVIQSTLKEKESMKVEAETKQVVPGAPNKDLVSGEKSTEGVKQKKDPAKEGLPEVGTGYVSKETPKATISPAKEGKDSLKQTHGGDNASLVKESDAFISKLLGKRGLETGIDMKKKIWAMLQTPKGAELLGKVVTAADEVGAVRTGAALDFIVAKKKSTLKKPANT